MTMLQSSLRGIVHCTVVFCCRLLSHCLDLEVVGLEHVPASGPVLISCRHFHHVWDGVILLAVSPGFTRFVVALDWVRNRCERFLLERGCRLLDWPVILRPDSVALAAGHSFQAEDARRYIRRGASHTILLLRAGEIVVIFPEAYPNVDPLFTPKRNHDAFLPFRPGFIRLIDCAQRDGCTRVAIVPAGLHYRRGRRWQVTLRFGEPLYLEAGNNRATLLQIVEDRVRALSEAG